MSTESPPSVLTDALDARQVPYELIEHPRTTTAADEARAIGVDPTHVAKTLVVSTATGLVRALLPASHRIDMRKVRTLVEDPHAELATEEMLAGAYPEFELGAVPPMGGHGPDSVLVDERLAKEPSVVFEAGSHEHSVRMTTADVLSLTNARVADIRQD